MTPDEYELAFAVDGPGIKRQAQVYACTATPGFVSTKA